VVAAQKVTLRAAPLLPSICGGNEADGIGREWLPGLLSQRKSVSSFWHAGIERVAGDRSREGGPEY
jgi:hypothetical protein